MGRRSRARRTTATESTILPGLTRRSISACFRLCRYRSRRLLQRVRKAPELSAPERRGPQDLDFQVSMTDPSNAATIAGVTEIAKSQSSADHGKDGGAKGPATLEEIA